MDFLNDRVRESLVHGDIALLPRLLLSARSRPWGHGRPCCRNQSTSFENRP
jgi:hypothetical protein